MEPSGFPAGFFDRADCTPDRDFYRAARLVTHIDRDAIDAVGRLYDELGLRGEVLDLMGSWVSHFRQRPAALVVLGLNALELRTNAMAVGAVVHDVNTDVVLPFRDASFDAAVCCVSIDYLVHPIEVFRDVARVLRSNAPFVCTFSNRLFPTKAIRGWLYATDEQRCQIVATYFRASAAWDEPRVERCTPPQHRGDPLFAVWARRRDDRAGAQAQPPARI